MVFPPLGVYFGNRAKNQIALSVERATAGIVVGWVFTILYVILMLVWCGLVGTMFATAPTT